MAEMSDWYWVFDAVLGSRLVRLLTDDSRLFRLEHRLEVASALLGSFRVPSTPITMARTTPTPTPTMIHRVRVTGRPAPVRARAGRSSGGRTPALTCVLLLWLLVPERLARRP